MLVARKMQSNAGDLGFVGEVTSVRPDLLKLLGDNGYVPVVCSVAIGEDGETYNVNADHAAGAIAASVAAAKLIVLTDVEGLYTDPLDPASVISEMSPVRAREMLASGAADKGMIPKLEACITALEGGVERAHLIDGRVPHALLIEVFTDSGIGTMIRA
jgi:acetylglutamate kinase